MYTPCLFIYIDVILHLDCIVLFDCDKKLDTVIVQLFCYYSVMFSNSLRITFYWIKLSDMTPTEILAIFIFDINQAFLVVT